MKSQTTKRNPFEGAAKAATKQLSTLRQVATEYAAAKNQTTVELSVDRLETGCIAVDLTLGDRTFYIELGKTRYSAYIEGEQPGPIYFEGQIDG